MSASLSVAALPPLPSAALDVRAPSGSKEHQSATADDSGDGDEDDAALNGLWAALVDDLLQEIHLDLCVQLHKEARTKGWTPAAPAPVALDLFGQPLQTRKLAEQTFHCQSCGHKTGSSKYAAHLEKCTGKGGRTSRRAARAGGSSHATAGSHAAAASAAPVAPASSAAAAAASLSARIEEDDVEVMAAADASAAAPLSARGGGSGSGTMKRPLSALTAGAASPSAAQHYRSHSSTSLSPYPDSIGTGTGMSPYPSEQAWSHPHQQDGGSVAGDMATSSSSAGSKGQKRRAIAAGLDSAATAGASGSTTTTAKRKLPRAEEFWAEPLPVELPTSAAAGGQPFLLLLADLSGPAPGTAPEPHALAHMLSRVCGASSAVTNKMCVNKPSCGTHSEVDRVRVRQLIVSGQAEVRFKRVKPPPPRAKPTAALSSVTAAVTAQQSQPQYHPQQQQQKQQQYQYHQQQPQSHSHAQGQMSMHTHMQQQQQHPSQQMYPQQQQQQYSGMPPAYHHSHPQQHHSSSSGGSM